MNPNLMGGSSISSNKTLMVTTGTYPEYSKEHTHSTRMVINTKMTEIIMMTLTPQLRKIAIKKRASHASSIRKTDLDFRSLVG